MRATEPPGEGAATRGLRGRGTPRDSRAPLGERIVRHPARRARVAVQRERRARRAARQPLEHASLQDIRNARPGIVDLQDGPPVFAGADMNRHVSTMRRIADRVIDEIERDGMHERGICPDRDLGARRAQPEIDFLVVRENG